MLASQGPETSWGSVDAWGRTFPWQFGAGVRSDQLLWLVVWRLVFVRFLPALTPIQYLGSDLRSLGWMSMRTGGGCELRWTIVRPGFLVIWRGRLFVAVVLGVALSTLAHTVLVGLPGASAALIRMMRWASNRLDEQRQREASLLHAMLDDLRRAVSGGDASGLSGVSQSDRPRSFAVVPTASAARELSLVAPGDSSRAATWHAIRRQGTRACLGGSASMGARR